MEKPSLKMTLRECLVRFPQLKDKLYELIEECIYCEGFQNEELKEVFEAHGLHPEKALKELLKELEK